MNKKEYLKKLKQELKARNVKNIGDIIADYDELIDIKMREGSTEQEVLNGLGNIKDLADSYGNKKKQTGNTNGTLFGLLQVFNVFIGAWIVISVLAVVIAFAASNIGFVVGMVYIVIKIISGSFTTVPALLLAISLIAIFIFLIGLFTVISKCLFILVYNYVIYNINLIKSEKLSYKRIRARKTLLIITAISLVVSIVTAMTSVAIAGADFDVSFREFEIGISTISDYRLDEEETYEYDKISNMDVYARNVEIIRGDENVIITNTELDYSVQNGTLILKEEGNSFTIGIDFNSTTKITIVTKDEIDNVTVDAASVTLEDINANDYEIDASSVEINEQNTMDTKSISYNIDAVDVIMNIEDVNIENIEVDCVNGVFEFNYLEAEKMVFSGVDTIIDFNSSKVDHLDVKDNVSVDINLEKTRIKTLIGKEFSGVIEQDDKSQIDNIK